MIELTDCEFEIIREAIRVNLVSYSHKYELQLYEALQILDKARSRDGAKPANVSSDAESYAQARR